MNLKVKEKSVLDKEQLWGSSGRIEKLVAALFSELGGIAELPVCLVEPFSSNGASSLFPSDLHPFLTLPSTLLSLIFYPSIVCIACQAPATHRILGLPVWGHSILHF